MKRKSFLLAIVLAAATAAGGGMGESSTVFAAQTNQTVKDYQNHVHKADIEYAVKNQLMWLFPDGNFRPDQTITQADLVVGIAQAKGLTQGIEVKNIPANHWAKTYYERTMKDGILSNVQIDPNKVLTREDAAFLLVNAWESLRNTRTDKESERNKSQSQVYYIASAGFMIGKSGEFPNGVQTGRFDSKSLMSRGETAYSLHKLHEDTVGIKEAEEMYSKFRNSLKITDGRVTGIIPNSEKYSLDITLYINGPKVEDFSKPGNISMNVSQAYRMVVRVVYKGKAMPQALYQYTKLPNSLDHENLRR
ncbi:S-layer homology domain-containing protein [Brevibacillus reuszeri]|uniref:S-layer homology domain-containing protein n=1 Tax=Brevibacillus reuszeri TaxID=54915 RepID=UPI00289D9E99|nr:S-layer homology domain-containing protein [Brevibacillus reuszeri]